MPISGDIFKINQVYELIQEDSWPNDFYVRPDETAGWFAGGSSLSSVDRITFASDTSTASARGILNTVRALANSEGNLNFGWITAGISTGTPAPALSSVDRITFASDTSTASARGILNTTKYYHSYFGNDNYGWQLGGILSPSSGTFLSQIERITYNDDTSQATTRGNLNSTRAGGGSMKSFNYGWFIGGQIPSIVSNITRLTLDSDTETSIIRGNMSLPRWGFTSTENVSYGWSAGGNSPATPARVSTIDRLTFATDTETASVRGPLTTSPDQLSSTSNNNYGWFGAGALPGARSTVSRITFSDDTITSVDRGALSVARQGPTAMEGLI